MWRSGLHPIFTILFRRLNMNNLKLYIASLFCLIVAGCSGSPLTSGTPPAGRLFAQVALETLGDHHDFVVESYAIHLQKAAIVMGDLSFIPAEGASTMKFHEGEDHGEPEACDFEGAVP